MKELCFALLIVLVTSSSAFSTTMSARKYKCSVCGAEDEYRVITSTNAFGPADLDLRPPEMQRSTMPLWVQECSECGYTASEISDACGVNPDFLKSEGYISCEGMKFKSKLAAKFYRQYMIARECGKTREALFAVLHSAWSCDDEKDSANAKLCREKAASLAGELIAGGSLIGSQRENIMLMRADILRRAGHFEEVISQYSDVKFVGGGRNNPEVMNAIVKFQVEKALKEDAGCYTIADALGE
ncbi:MAG: hypothetical protein IJG51_06180 [Synergistaceae bacterium]|nr:hypothetical protein [Synergistaceae bacterium]MBQ4400901.1 hypothetical protein [Synergistaceae bacterium]MBQ6417337.1 hypothetical protein [Synergistaceae bacterium]